MVCEAFEENVENGQEKGEKHDHSRIKETQNLFMGQFEIFSDHDGGDRTLHRYVFG